jgi:RNA polymerase sigma factor (sigma-70 family)
LVILRGLMVRGIQAPGFGALLMYDCRRSVDHRRIAWSGSDPIAAALRIGSMDVGLFAIGRDEKDGAAAPASRPIASVSAPLWVDPMKTVVEFQADDRADPSLWIIAIAKERSRESFALLFGRFAPRVKSYMLKLGAKPELAEELAQETLLTVWRKAAYFDPSRASASTWIFTIARNLRIDALRRERHPDDLIDEPGLQPVEQARADDALSSCERESRLRLALKTLPQEQAEVVRLSFFHDKAHAQISAELGVALGTVKSRLRLAMVRLRAQLEELL